MSDFYLYALDADFDIVNDTLPNSLLFNFGDQLDRARAVLKGRSSTQIKQGLESLDWMLRKGGDMMMAQAIESATERGIFVDRVKALCTLMNSANVDLERQMQLPGAAWAEVFALLTLAYVSETLYMINNPSEGLNNLYLQFGLNPSNYDDRNQYITDWAIEAMEAVCYAERLQSNSEPLPDDKRKLIRKHMQELGSKGGKLRTAHFGQLRSKCLELYSKQYSHRSNRYAARRIYKDLTEDERRIFITDVPTNTIEVWIGKFKRAQTGL